jgi:hypothetical protein
MAALTPDHWETTTADMRGVVAHLARQPFMRRFYLGGGTAVALRLGHRHSYDLDFFSSDDEVLAPTRRLAVRALAPFGPAIVEDVDGDLVVSLGALHVAFLGYGYDLVERPDDAGGVAVASLVDLGLMKLDALISRGSRKDFYDLYFMLQVVELPHLLHLGKVKYPYATDFELMAVESLILFDNADRDLQPELLINVAWPSVRTFFQDLARSRAADWW